MQQEARVLYVGAAIPRRSETFVYREVLALRTLGDTVFIASVHHPERGLGDPRLEELAEEAIPVYGPGFPALLGDAAIALGTSPRAWRVLARAVLDALQETGGSIKNRGKIVWHALAGLALARRVRHLNIHHIHSHMAHVPTSIAMYAAQTLCLSFSFTGHANDLFVRPALLKRKIERARFVSCISYWHREFYRALAPRHDEDLPVVRCGVDIEQFAPRSAGFTSTSPTVVSVGRLVPKKGFDDLIRTVGHLIARGIAVRCLLVGDGPQAAELRRLAEELHLQDVVSFLGAQSSARVIELLHHADLFVLPCKTDATGDRDGIPVVLIEAMACSVCSVAGDSPTLRELIQDGVNGRLVEPGEPALQADVLEHLIRSSDVRNKLAQAGRRTVEDEFSLARNAAALHRLFCRAT